jgi:hypothetical protein
MISLITSISLCLLIADVKDTSLTIYNNNIASVNQVYADECKKGIFDTTIKNMPRTIISDSINLNLPDYLSLKLQSYKNENTDYINQEVSILTKDNSIIKGILYKNDGESYTIRNENGEYVVVLKEYVKYVNYGKFDEIDFKNRMINNGVLKLVFDSKKDGDCEFGVNYILNNISWNASYDAYLNDDETKLDINARIVITNNTGYNFKNARVLLVAGDINRVLENISTFKAMSKAMMASSFEDSASEEIKPSQISEFYSYNLPFKNITINDGETLSLDMFSRKGIKFKKLYIYKGQQDMWYFYDNLKSYRYDKNLTANLIFENNKENSMDIPLPAGNVRIYKKNGNFISMVGEDKIKHTAANSKIELTLGRAFDVSGKRVILDHKKVRTNVYRDTIEITLKNEKNEDINVKVKEYLWGNWSIVEASHKYTKIDANNIEFDIKVPKKSSTTIKYTAEYDLNQ